MKYLLEKEERLLLAVLKESKSATRDYMLIDLILNTGLRLNEVRSLTVRDVKESVAIRSHLIVRPETAKRGKSREIRLSVII